MKKTFILGALALGCAFTSCEKEEVLLEETTVQEISTENETQVRGKLLENGVWITTLELWLYNRYMEQHLSTDPGDDATQEYFALNADDLDPVIGEERVYNIISRKWTLETEGVLAEGKLYTIYFLDEGIRVDGIRVDYKE